MAEINLKTDIDKDVPYVPNIKSKAKSKAEMMRTMRLRRKEQGLVQVTYWLSIEQIEMIELLLKSNKPNQLRELLQTGNGDNVY